MNLFSILSSDQACVQEEYTSSGTSSWSFVVLIWAVFLAWLFSFEETEHVDDLDEAIASAAKDTGQDYTGVIQYVNEERVFPVELLD